MKREEGVQDMVAIRCEYAGVIPARPVGKMEADLATVKEVNTRTARKKELFMSMPVLLAKRIRLCDGRIMLVKDVDEERFLSWYAEWFGKTEECVKTLPRQKRKKSGPQTTMEKQLLELKHELQSHPVVDDYEKWWLINYLYNLAAFAPYRDDLFCL